MKLTCLKIAAITLICSCSSAPDPEKITKTDQEKETEKAEQEQAIAKQNTEWMKKTQDWQNEKKIQDQKNTKINEGFVGATQPVLKVDMEKIKIVQQKAEEGDADYQYSLGMCYKYGYGLKQDTNQALFWFKKAADQGHQKAAQVYRYMLDKK